jgi:hypothetical protein
MPMGWEGDWELLSGYARSNWATKVVRDQLASISLVGTVQEFHAGRTAWYGGLYHGLADMNS